MYIIDKKSRASFELEDGAVIGRDPASDIVIDDISVSRAHAQIEVTDEGVVLTDLGSSRGTFVNKQRMEVVLLEAGMVIAFGGARFEVVNSVQAQSFDPRVAPLSQLQFKPASELWDQNQLHSDYERLRVVYELNRALGVEDDLDRLLKRVLDSAFTLLSAERGVIQLFESTGEPRTLTHPEDGTEEVRLSQTVVDEVVRDRKGLIVADAQLHETLSRAASIAVEGVRSVMCVPLLYEDEVLGVIQVDSLHTTHAFGPSDLVLFSTIASQSAVIVKHLLRQRQAEEDARFALVGQVAGGLSRDLNALLGAIADGARELGKRSAEPAVAETTSAMLAAVAKATDLIGELLPFDGEGVTDNVDEIVQTWLQSFSASAPPSLKIDWTPNAPTGVPLGEGQLVGVLKNLVHNARDALGGKGCIQVRTWTDGDAVALEVKDDGPGIAEEIRAKLFEPFVTTKGRGEGTGLGLSSVLGIVKPKGGRVVVESEPGWGATFRVYLPRTAAPRPAGRTKTLAP
ncbi:MAG: ATP-binding protein [Myxococcota bacterium]